MTFFSCNWCDSHLSCENQSVTAITRHVTSVNHVSKSEAFMKGKLPHNKEKY